MTETPPMDTPEAIAKDCDQFRIESVHPYDANIFRVLARRIRDVTARLLPPEPVKPMTNRELLASLPVGSVVRRRCWSGGTTSTKYADGKWSSHIEDYWNNTSSDDPNYGIEVLSRPDAPPPEPMTTTQCPPCRGSGMVWGTQCNGCHGAGVIRTPRPDAPDAPPPVEVRDDMPGSDVCSGCSNTISKCDCKKPAAPASPPPVAVEAEGDELPLPTGERTSRTNLAWIMSGMPKVGRTSVDIHVFDALRAEVLALQPTPTGDGEASEVEACFQRLKAHDEACKVGDWQKSPFHLAPAIVVDPAATLLFNHTCAVLAREYVKLLAARTP